MTTPLVLLISLHADPFSPSGVGAGGGTHAYLRELMKELAFAGRPCALITRRAEPASEPVEILNRSIRLFRIDIGPPGPLDKRRLNEFHDEAMREARRILTELPTRPGLIHSVYWNSGRLALDLSQETGIPYVHTVISNGVRRRLEGAHDQPRERERIERKVFSRAWTIFSVSGEEKDDLVSHYGVDTNRIRVVGRPVDASFLYPAHDESGQPRPIRFELR
jgi:D-inositol-3-phosphate glycosyltransferase